MVLKICHCGPVHPRSISLQNLFFLKKTHDVSEAGCDLTFMK
jgi:hypothetical protein